MPRRIPNILSLDLDWFNWIDLDEHGTAAKKQMVMDFFAHLRLRCTLPQTVAFMTEHHYFYPWCAELMKSLKTKRVNVYNVDQHHDFYFLRDIDDFDTHLVSCANFFAFMAHHGMINSYHWVLNDAKLDSHTRALKRELRGTYSRPVKDLSQRCHVSPVKKVWEVLDRKKFDGVAIVKSLDYTEDQDIVFSTVDTVMRRYFTPVHGVRVGRSPCRADYEPKERPSLNVSNLLPA
jgi:hypothetical protein